MQLAQTCFLASVIALSACGGCKSDNNVTTVDASPGDASDPDSSRIDAGDASDMTSGVLAIESLAAPVTARYDSAGVLHLRCGTPRDCFIAEGYFHASDRFLQMDLTRNQTRGKLSQMVGFLSGFDTDVLWRTRTISLDGDPLEDLYFEALSDSTKDVFRAYSEGVNAWLDHARRGVHGARLSEEYDSPLLYDVQSIREWEPQDSLTPFFQLAYTYAGAGADTYRGDEAATFDPAVFGDLYGLPTVRPSNITDAATQNLLRPWTPRPQLSPEWQATLRRSTALLASSRDRERRGASVLFGPAVPGHGSNSWAVGGARTASGGAILENDPHLSITNPSIWYLVEMQSDDGELHIAGASIPCGPGVVLGHNEHIAWGATIAMYDLADVYLETLTPDGMAVDRGGQRVELLRYEYSFEGGDGFEPRTATIEVVPDHGPILQKDPDTNTALALRWVAQDAGADLDFLPKIWAAKTVAEAETALNELRIININWTVADTTGSIGWFPAVAIPDRSAWAATQPHWLPLPGDGSAEWTDWVADADIPRLLDPVAGYIATANNDFTGSWDDGDNTNDLTPPLQYPLPVGAAYRHGRIVASLAARNDHTLASTRELLSDTHIVHGEVLTPEIVETAMGLAGLSPAAQSVRSALEGWDYTCPSGLSGSDPEASDLVNDAAVMAASAGCLAFHVTLVYLTSATFEDEFSGIEDQYAFKYWQDYQATLVHLFVNPTALGYGEMFFDDTTTTPVVETREDIVASALESAGTWIEGTYGSIDASTWAWGRVHTLDQRSLLPVGNYGEGPFATGGGFQSVDMADPGIGSAEIDMTHSAGGSVRLIYELGSGGVSAKFELPGGQVLRRDSPFYQSLLADWLAGTSTDLLFESEAIDGDTQETVVIAETAGP